MTTMFDLYCFIIFTLLIIGIIHTFMVYVVDYYEYERTPRATKYFHFRGISVIVICIGLFITATLTIHRKEGTDYRKIDEIVSLERNFDIEGSFIIGIGSVETVSYYYVYRMDQTVNGDLAYRLKRYMTADTLLVETTKIPPQYGEYYCENREFYCVTSQVLYLPPNTIKREFKTN